MDDEEPEALPELDLDAELDPDIELDAELELVCLAPVTLDTALDAVCLELKSPLPFKNCERAEDSSMESDVVDARRGELEVGNCRMPEESLPDSPKNEYTVVGALEDAPEACASAAAVLTTLTVLSGPSSEAEPVCSFKGAH